MNKPPRLVTLGILEREGKCLMQLRDDLPHILYPGCWGLFGGHLEVGETSEIGFKREILEEIGFNVIDLLYVANASILSFLHYLGSKSSKSYF